MLFAVGLLLLCSAVSASDDFQCTIIPGKLVQIDAGAGEVCGVSENGNIYRLVDNSWKQIPGGLKHVTIGPAGLWGAAKDNTIYKFQDNNWALVTGLLKQVDAGGDKFLSGVNANDNIYCLRQSCTVSKSTTVNFSQLEGSLKYYSCGGLSCWGVNLHNQIFYRHNVNPKDCKGTSWQQIAGTLSMLEVGTDGSVFGVDPTGNVFKRAGITAKTPMGASWTKLDFCATFKHATYDNGYLWLLNDKGDIYRCSDQK